MRILAAASPACLLFIGGCTFTSILSKPSTQPEPYKAPETRSQSLSIPADQLPSPGECRLWLPDIPPAQQSAPGPCASVQRKVPAGAWVLFRSEQKPNEVAVNVYRSKWPWIVSETRYFDYWTGGFLRAE